MKIIVDAMGGDNAPQAPVMGAIQANKEDGVEIILVGRGEDILKTLADNGISDLPSGMEIAHAPTVIPVCEEPTQILKKYKDCSMAKGFQMLAAGEGDAFITAGSTGAMVVGATMIVKRIKGVKRAAIGTVIPNAKGHYMLLDSGANEECRPEMLRQFGVMGSVYMEHIMKIPSPRVGLVNIGTEDSKGTGLQVEANQLLRQAGVNYVGNVEARELPLGGCDVAVADGFTGNVALKLTEGMAPSAAKTMWWTGFPPALGPLRRMKYNFCERAGGSPPIFAGANTPEGSTAMTLEQRIGYQFKNGKYLRRALTHSSYSNESREKPECNERLEFLGDAVLSLVVSNYIFHRFHLNEGDLTKIRASIVCEKSLFRFAGEIGLGEELYLGRGEEQMGGRTRPSIVSDAFEALIAAIFLDGGLEPASRFILRFVREELDTGERSAFVDYKTMLQEIVQKNPEEKVSYVLVEENGPDHDKHFVVEVRLNSNVIGRGEFRSKKGAEQLAAKEALELMGE